jgi:transcriptional antiterminator RfaH
MSIALRPSDPSASAAARQDSASAGGQWYLVQLKPGGGDRARRNLDRLGFETFMPMRWETRRRSGRMTENLRPLFPGYLFVLFRPGESRWRVINSTYGVARIVCLEGGRPTPVPEALMRSLKAACNTDGVLRQREALCPGQDVRVIRGPFAGFPARIEAMPDRERVFILLEMMGRMVGATVSTAHIEAL